MTAFDLFQKAIFTQNMKNEMDFTTTLFKMKKKKKKNYMNYS